MPKLLTDDGKRLSHEARVHIGELLDSKRIVRTCCVAPGLVLDDTMSGFRSVSLSEKGRILELETGIVTVVVLCQSCGEVRSYSLKTLLPDLNDWLEETA
jgi:hypothetical protein